MYDANSMAVTKKSRIKYRSGDVATARVMRREAKKFLKYWKFKLPFGCSPYDPIVDYNGKFYFADIVIEDGVPFAFLQAEVPGIQVPDANVLDASAA